MDDERMKDPVGWDYFDELLQRIREVGTSDKRSYQKVHDLFALSVDYKRHLLCNLNWNFITVAQALALRGSPQPTSKPS